VCGPDTPSGEPLTTRRAGLQVMMKLKSAKNLDARQTMLLEHAYFQVRAYSALGKPVPPHWESLSLGPCTCPAFRPLHAVQAPSVQRAAACAGAAAGAHGAAEEAAAAAARLHPPPAARCACTGHPAACGFLTHLSSAYSIKQHVRKQATACTALQTLLGCHASSC
jgi:hypothetical protein